MSNACNHSVGATLSAKLMMLTCFAMSAFAANSLLCRLALKHGLIDAASFSAVRLFSGALVLWLLCRCPRPARPIQGSWIGAGRVALIAGQKAQAGGIAGTSTAQDRHADGVVCNAIGAGLNFLRRGCGIECGGVAGLQVVAANNPVTMRLQLADGAGEGRRG